jgi:hypothetical protein
LFVLSTQHGKPTDYGDWVSKCRWAKGKVCKTGQAAQKGRAMCKYHCDLEDDRKARKLQKKLDGKSKKVKREDGGGGRDGGSGGVQPQSTGHTRHTSGTADGDDHDGDVCGDNDGGDEGHSTLKVTKRQPLVIFSIVGS